jgi:hypothetical protein
LGFGACSFSAWLVVAGGVEGELAEDLAGGLVDDADVEVVDEHEDGLAGVGASDAMWCMRPARRSDRAPVLSTRSWRTRWWVPALDPRGAALGSSL